MDTFSPTPSRPQRRLFERLYIVFPILLAGWIPSLMALWVSYQVISNAPRDEEFLRDRQTFVQLIGTPSVT